MSRPTIPVDFERDLCHLLFDYDCATPERPASRGPTRSAAVWDLLCEHFPSIEKVMWEHVRLPFPPAERDRDALLVERVVLVRQRIWCLENHTVEAVAALEAENRRLRKALEYARPVLSDINGARDVRAVIDEALGGQP